MDSRRSYSELSTLKTFKERFEYLKLDGVVGDATFGYDRYLNQVFYKTPEWKRFRDQMIIRDNGCDLGSSDLPLTGRIYLHHINPITKEDILNRTANLFDPENVICCSFSTHNALHYGDSSLLAETNPIERKEFDTCPWKKTQ